MEEVYTNFCGRPSCSSTNVVNFVFVYTLVALCPLNISQVQLQMLFLTHPSPRFQEIQWMPNNGIVASSQLREAYKPDYAWISVSSWAQQKADNASVMPGDDSSSNLWSGFTGNR